jgi:predicted lipoprotein with Yx(FWY)xxD motif
MYVFTADIPQHSACTGACLQQRPPVLGPARAGQGVRQTNLATFTRPDRTRQATFFGHQLYYFTGDTQPGQANGQATGQGWFLVNPAGHPIRP